MKYKLVFFYHIYIIQPLCFVSLALKLAIARKNCCVFFCVGGVNVKTYKFSTVHRIGENVCFNIVQLQKKA